MEQDKEEQRAYWRGLLAEQKENGQSVATFCREHGLREWQFYEWKKRLSLKSESFVAVEVVASPPTVVPAPLTPTLSAPLEIRLRSGRSVLVGPAFEASHLLACCRCWSRSHDRLAELGGARQHSGAAHLVGDGGHRHALRL